METKQNKIYKITAQELLDKLDIKEDIKKCWIHYISSKDMLEIEVEE